ncbi:hypothetical protein RUK17_002033 [Vibrio cholerae]|uniref:hypothetical protein n=1 Tax=Vibrio cholerae TaxID=666 RepID=UPI00053CA3DF|nr:hypothetical protein [Vibrio cholerae]EGQ8096660.1 hypothetical protein [Vibrio cholerae]EGQ9890338.1 hypothetical protein [Vibrio cholerae]EGR0940617.1 hypothetical protein [Vibrio cholerae]EGR1419646.1 hypothetical protein [Vibrio cholerae]EGR1451987.1 hypothetical protein [Vibrio cholerae]
MYLRVLIQCWFALLAVALPSQVFAYALESEASSACPEASISTNPILESDWLLSSAPQPAIPSSQSHVSHSAYAILNHSRHAPTQRLLVGCGSDLPLDADFDEPQLGTSHSRPLFATTTDYCNRSYDFFTSSHRLAGWKESNAMYVALNSQF